MRVLVRLAVPLVICYQSPPGFLSLCGSPPSAFKSYIPFWRELSAFAGGLPHPPSLPVPSPPPPPLSGISDVQLENEYGLIGDAQDKHYIRRLGRLSVPLETPPPLPPPSLTTPLMPPHLKNCNHFWRAVRK